MSDSKLTVYIAMSLDGFIAGKNDDISWLSMVDDENQDYGYSEFYKSIDAVILGRKTYDVVMDLVDEFPHSSKESYVITRQENHYNNLFYNGDISALVVKLKSEGKSIFCDGGAGIVNNLLSENLVDDLIISVIPIILGDGTVLFHDGNPRSELTLNSVQSYPMGVAQLHYSFK